MRILVVGAGRTGAKVVRQLRKSPGLEVMTLDPRTKPHAVREKVIAAVDFEESLTPLTLDNVLQRAKPDLILLAMAAEDMGLGQAVGVEMLSHALWDELATISDVPVIEVARSGA